MVTAGLVGGLGPESTIDYYRRILEAWRLHDSSSSPSLVIDSLDVQRGLRLVASDRAAFADYLLQIDSPPCRSCVEFVAITANTPHLVFDELAEHSPVPLISIVEVCAAAARQLRLDRVLLLGTRFTMEAPFYSEVCARLGVTVVVPEEVERIWIHEYYVTELLHGQFRDDSRARFVSLVERWRDEQGIEGVILGGTELPLLLPGAEIARATVLDTTALHVAAIVERLRHDDSRSEVSHA